MQVVSLSDGSIGLYICNQSRLFKALKPRRNQLVLERNQAEAFIPLEAMFKSPQGSQKLTLPSLQDTLEKHTLWQSSTDITNTSMKFSESNSSNKKKTSGKSKSKKKSMSDDNEAENVLSQLIAKPAIYNDRFGLLFSDMYDFVDLLLETPDIYLDQDAATVQAGYLAEQQFYFLDFASLLNCEDVPYYIIDLSNSRTIGATTAQTTGGNGERCDLVILKPNRVLSAADIKLMNSKLPHLWGSHVADTSTSSVNDGIKRGDISGNMSSIKDSKIDANLYTAEKLPHSYSSAAPPPSKSILKKTNISNAYTPLTSLSMSRGSSSGNTTEISTISTLGTLASTSSHGHSTQSNKRRLGAIESCPPPFLSTEDGRTSTSKRYDCSDAFNGDHLSLSSNHMNDTQLKSFLMRYVVEDLLQTENGNGTATSPGGSEHSTFSDHSTDGDDTLDTYDNNHNNNIDAVEIKLSQYYSGNRVMIQFLSLLEGCGYTVCRNIWALGNASSNNHKNKKHKGKKDGKGHWSDLEDIIVAPWYTGPTLVSTTGDVLPADICSSYPSTAATVPSGLTTTMTSLLSQPHTAPRKGVEYFHAPIDVFVFLKRYGTMYTATSDPRESLPEKSNVRCLELYTDYTTQTLSQRLKELVTSLSVSSAITYAKNDIKRNHSKDVKDEGMMMIRQRQEKMLVSLLLVSGWKQYDGYEGAMGDSKGDAGKLYVPYWSSNALCITDSKGTGRSVQGNGKARGKRGKRSEHSNADGDNDGCLTVSQCIDLQRLSEYQENMDYFTSVHMICSYLQAYGNQPKSIAGDGNNDSQSQSLAFTPLPTTTLPLSQGMERGSSSTKKATHLGLLSTLSRPPLPVPGTGGFGGDSTDTSPEKDGNMDQGENDGVEFDDNFDIECTQVDSDSESHELRLSTAATKHAHGDDDDSNQGVTALPLEDSNSMAMFTDNPIDTVECTQIDIEEDSHPGGQNMTLPVTGSGDGSAYHDDDYYGDANLLPMTQVDEDSRLSFSDTHQALLHDNSHNESDEDADQGGNDSKYDDNDGRNKGSALSVNQSTHKDSKTSVKANSKSSLASVQYDEVSDLGSDNEAMIESELRQFNKDLKKAKQASLSSQNSTSSTDNKNTKENSEDSEDHAQISSHLKPRVRDTEYDISPDKPSYLNKTPSWTKEINTRPGSGMAGSHLSGGRTFGKGPAKYTFSPPTIGTGNEERKSGSTGGKRKIKMPINPKGAMGEINDAVPTSIFTPKASDINTAAFSHGDLCWSRMQSTARFWPCLFVSPSQCSDKALLSLFNKNRGHKATEMVYWYPDGSYGMVQPSDLIEYQYGKDQLLLHTKAPKEQDGKKKKKNFYLSASLKEAIALADGDIDRSIEDRLDGILAKKGARRPGGKQAQKKARLSVMSTVGSEGDDSDGEAFAGTPQSSVASFGTPTDPAQALQFHLERDQGGARVGWLTLWNILREELGWCSGSVNGAWCIIPPWSRPFLQSSKTASGTAKLIVYGNKNSNNHTVPAEGTEPGLVRGVDYWVDDEGDKEAVKIYLREFGTSVPDSHVYEVMIARLETQGGQSRRRRSTVMHNASNMDDTSVGKEKSVKQKREKSSRTNSARDTRKRKKETRYTFSHDSDDEDEDDEDDREEEKGVSDATGGNSSFLNHLLQGMDDNPWSKSLQKEGAADGKDDKDDQTITATTATAVSAGGGTVSGDVDVKEGGEEVVAMSMKQALLAARQALLPSSWPRQSDHVGREAESEEIRGWISGSVAQGRGGNMYICGRPGSGKTTTIGVVLATLLGDDDSEDGGWNSNLSTLQSVTTSTDQHPSRSQGKGNKTHHPSLFSCTSTVFGLKESKEMKSYGSDSSCGNGLLIVKAQGTTLEEKKLYLDILVAVYPFLPSVLSRKIDSLHLSPSLMPNSHGGCANMDEEEDTTAMSSVSFQVVKEVVLAYLQQPSNLSVDRAGADPGVLLLIDEIDKAPRQVITQLMDLGDNKRKLLLVGLANTINFPDSLTLQSQLGPKTIVFETYTHLKLKAILEQRAYGLFNPRAVEAIARKVDARSGDVRLLLQLGHQLIEKAVEAMGNDTANESEINDTKKGTTGWLRHLSDTQLAAPVSNIVQLKDSIKFLNTIGMGSTRIPELVKSLPPIGRAVVVSLVTARLPQPTTLPQLYQAYNSYASMLGMESMSKEELTRWVSQLVDYMLLLKGDSTKQGRRVVDTDAVLYRVEVKAVDLLRVSNMESAHKRYINETVEADKKVN